MTFSIPVGLAPDDALRRIFPKRLSVETQCPARDDVSLDVERQHGWILPRLITRRSGSFTRRGAVEEAILFAVGECHATHAENFGSKELVVFDDASRIVFRSGEIFYDDIALATDLDLDGLDELVLTVSGMAQGHAEMHATLIAIPNGSLRSRDLGEVAVDDRGAGPADAGGRAGVLVVRPAPDGGFPVLRVEMHPF